MNRRNLITGLISFVAAPAIIRVAPVMKVKPIGDHDLTVTPMFNNVRIGQMMIVNNEMYIVVGVTDNATFKMVQVH